MKKWILWAAVLAVAAMVPAYAADNDDEDKGEDTRPFVSIDKEHIVNKTGISTANFSTLIDRLNNDLVESGLYRVMDMEDALKAIQRDEKMSVLGDGEAAGTNIKTPAFFVGMTITSFGWARAASQNALTGAVAAHEQAKVELILKIVDGRTAETIKSKNIDGSASGAATTAANVKEQVLQAACKTAVQKIVYELIKLTPFGVLDVENGVVSLDVPGSLRIMGKPVLPGTQFTVSKKGRGKKSKRTGKVTYSEQQVALVGVTAVGEESCTAKILSGAIPPIGDDEDTQYDPYIVKINEGATAPSPMVAPPPPPPGDGAPF